MEQHTDHDIEVRPRPQASAGAMPDDPSAARAQIEMTRARMSETIDEIEEAILRKKARLQQRLDVTAPVRENPMRSAGMALGAGLLLGLLTGGDDEEDEDLDGYRHRLREAEDRAETWENRARRLMRIAREQEEEIDRLSRDRVLEEEWEDDGFSSRFDGLRDRMDDLRGRTGELRERTDHLRHRAGDLREQVTDGLSSMLASAVQGLFSRR